MFVGNGLLSALLVSFRVSSYCFLCSSNWFIHIILWKVRSLSFLFPFSSILNYLFFIFSDDGGQTVKKENSELNRVMESAGRFMKMKPHRVGFTNPEVTQITKHMSQNNNCSLTTPLSLNRFFQPLVISKATLAEIKGFMSVILLAASLPKPPQQCLWLC